MRRPGAPGTAHATDATMGGEELDNGAKEENATRKHKDLQRQTLRETTAANARRKRYGERARAKETSASSPDLSGGRETSVEINACGADENYRDETRIPRHGDRVCSHV